VIDDSDKILPTDAAFTNNNNGTTTVSTVDFFYPNVEDP